MGNLPSPDEILGTENKLPSPKEILGNVEPVKKKMVRSH